MIRFAETNKWDDPWFRGLSCPSKLVFLYVIDRCNNAGFWERDDGALAFHTGLKQDAIEGAMKGLGRGLIQAGGWIWVRRFLKHQKNEILNEQNNAHKQIILLVRDQLTRFSQFSEFTEFLGANEGLISPIGKSKGLGLGNGKGQDRGSAEGEEILSESHAITQATNAAIDADFAKLVYDQWEMRGGKDGGGMRVPFIKLCSKRWSREKEDWNNGTHNSKKGNHNGKNHRTEADRDRDNTGINSDIEVPIFKPNAQR